MVKVLKSTGELEEFKEEKLLRSIGRVGIPNEMQQMVVSHVKKKLYDNIPTTEIYHHVSEFLDKSPHPFSKSKYRLKQAIMDFGPTGYPFEDFVAEVLKTEGYQTNVRQILTGKCINHEVDIVAEKDGIKSIIECKFHNNVGIRTQVHVSLYTKARFDDVKERNKIDNVWLVTNTQITKDALDYALCNNMTVISWNYPEGRGLRDLIEKSGLHPITALSTIPQVQKQNLLNQHVVLCKNIPQNLKLLNLPEDQKNLILQESKFVCKI